MPLLIIGFVSLLELVEVELEFFGERLLLPFSDTVTNSLLWWDIGLREAPGDDEFMGVDFELDSLGLRLGRFDSILATLASLVISYGLKGTDLESLTTMVGLPDLGAFFDLSELIFCLSIIFGPESAPI